MKAVTPYRSDSEAVVALDNGGRFYNLFTKAGDQEISSAELATVAGVFGDRQRMILFLEMSIEGLEKEEPHKVRDMLSADLRTALEKHAPLRLLPSEAKDVNLATRSAILTGFPRILEDKTMFTGFIMIPIMIGTLMTFMTVPMVDQFDIYELRDEFSDQVAILANERGSERLPETLHRFGGILKKTTKSEAGEGRESLYMETAYLTDL
jgi:hypothetical protein